MNNRDQCDSCKSFVYPTEIHLLDKIKKYFLAKLKRRLLSHKEIPDSFLECDPLFITKSDYSTRWCSECVKEGFGNE